MQGKNCVDRAARHAAKTMYISTEANCVLLANHHVICWGQRDANFHPAFWQSIEAKKIALYPQAFCWIDLDDQLHCLGQAPPIPINLGPISDFSMGFKHMCAQQKISTHLQCWSFNDSEYQPDFIPAANLGAINAFVASGQGTCVIDTMATLKCWPEALNRARSKK